MTAFLYEFLNIIIYIKQSHLFKLNFKFIYYLYKDLYRLKQALKVLI